MYSCLNCIWCTPCGLIQHFLRDCFLVIHTLSHDEAKHAKKNVLARFDHFLHFFFPPPKHEQLARIDVLRRNRRNARAFLRSSRHLNRLSPEREFFGILCVGSALPREEKVAVYLQQQEMRKKSPPVAATWSSPRDLELRTVYEEEVFYIFIHLKKQKKNFYKPNRITSHFSLLSERKNKKIDIVNKYEKSSLLWLSLYLEYLHRLKTFLGKFFVFFVMVS